jgi:lysophospholipase L1-like esterase
VVTLVFLFIVENTLAWTYVAKRSRADQPYTDLLERYFVLRPFTFYFTQQYTFPKELWPAFKGETSTPNGQRALYQADGLLGYRLSPNSVTTDKTWTWRGTNAQGLIITDRNNLQREYQIPKPGDVYRIIVLGGSTVEGDGASGSTTALPAMLQDVLSSRYIAVKRPKARIEVINAGVGGYYSTQELLLYISNLRHFQPDLVLAYNGWNDMKMHNEALQYHGPTAPQLWNRETEKNNQILNDYYKIWPTLGRAVEIIAQRIIETLESFALFHIPERGLSQLIDRAFQTTKEAAAQADLASPFFPKSVERYVDNIEMLILRNRADNVATAWFLQPLVGLGDKPLAAGRERSYFELYPKGVERRKTFYRFAEQSQREILRKYPKTPMTCAASLIDVFDGHPEELFEDSGHLYDKGNAIVAERIASELSTCGIIREIRDAGR